MDINKSELADKFREIVAIRLDVFDQIKDGIWPPNTDLKRWQKRYKGTPANELPPYCIEINHFKIEVDEFVSMLMQAVSVCQSTCKTNEQGEV